MNGSAFADTIIASGAGSITSGAGNDTITINTQANFAAATIDGGSGVDTLKIDAASTSFADSDFGNITGVEALTLKTGAANTLTSLGDIFNAAGVLTINGGTGIDTITFASGANIVINGGGESDIITGSTSDDYITFGSAIGGSGSGSEAVIDAGTGDDTITLKSGVANNASITGGTGADIIKLGAGHTGGVNIVMPSAEADADTISNFIHGIDKIELAGGTNNAAVGKAFSDLFEKADVTFPALAPGQTFTIAGLTVTGGSGGANGAEVAAEVFDGSTNDSTKVTVTGILSSSWVAAAALSGGNSDHIIYTSATAGDVTNLTASGANSSLVSVAVAREADAQYSIAFDTAARLGDTGIKIGDTSGATDSGTSWKVKYAVATDSGAIYFDSNGDWTSGSIQIGTVGFVTGLTADDFFVS